MQQRLLTYNEIVKEYGVTLWFWRTKFWEGRLPNSGFGNRHLFDRKDIEKLIKELKQTA